MTHMIFCLCPDVIDGVWAQSGDRCEPTTADTRQLTHARLTRTDTRTLAQTLTNTVKCAQTRSYARWALWCLWICVRDLRSDIRLTFLWGTRHIAMLRVRSGLE
ncbi:hypothetical protein QTP88_022587 [Uroleucon formosanum]